MIKIVTGHSNVGGSTTAFINLCNIFNNNGYDCTLYGPHNWHLNKCKSNILLNLRIDPSDRVISHFLDIGQKPNVKKHILSLHEKHLFPLKQKNISVYDKIHYVSNEQRLWHNVNHPYFISGNILEELFPNEKPKTKIGGIIGTIDSNKRVELSIQKALEDGCEQVLIFGTISDTQYFNQYIQPLISSRVIHIGYSENKQKMYDMITDVYQDSQSETWGYVKAECMKTNTNFHGNISTEKNFSIIESNEKILSRWIRELEL